MPMAHLLQKLAALLRDWRPPDPGPEPDPFSRVREPRGGGPTGRTSVMAVREPEPESSVRAVGRFRSR
jgi:hypothetical protein